MYFLDVLFISNRLSCYNVKCSKCHFLVTKQLIWLLTNSCLLWSNMYSIWNIT